MTKKIIIVYLVNFLLAVSTTIGMTLIPLLATEKLGMTLLFLGAIEGGTELISNLLRLFTGTLFDRIKNRQILFIAPATLAFVAKLLLYFPSMLTILISKITERVANGAFAAPRDAFIGENSKNKGMALGLLSVAKTFGCVVGPIIISLSTLLFGSLVENISNIIFLTCLISFSSLVLTFFIDTKKLGKINKLEKLDYKKMQSSFKRLLPLFIMSFFFFLGRFNDGLIIIYLRDRGLPEWYYLITISFFNIVMLLSSPLIGDWIDKGKDSYILIITITALLAFNIMFIQLPSLPWIFSSIGLVMWGIQRAAAQINFTAIIFKNIPVAYYGSAIGIYSVISGVGVFISSLICGYLAQKSFNYVFIFSGISSICSLGLAIIYIKKCSLSQKVSTL